MSQNYHATTFGSESPAALNAMQNETANGSLNFGGACGGGGGGGGSAWATPTRYSGSYEGFGFAPKHNNWRTSTPRRSEFHTDCSSRVRLVDLNNSSYNSTTFSNFSLTNSLSSRSFIRCTLPVWAVDSSGNVSPTVTLSDVLKNKALFEFATDKNGCRFLQEQYPTMSDGGGIHDEIFSKMVENRETFLTMCRNMFGNFFVQRIVECSKTEEQEIMMEHLVTDMFNLCLDKSACRVIQLAIQKLDIHLASRLAQELRGADLVRMSVDQNGNHVIQKIIKTLPVSAWDFVVEFFNKDEHLISVCQDKYGCRVVQSTIEKLSENPKGGDYKLRVDLLHSLMDGISRNCAQLASNEFANYVVQHVIKSGGLMETYRDVIIEKCLLRNLLSMAQEKYASHVVEVAFLFAPHHLMCEMMDEIFDGYFPHPDTNRDALDILLFHQYGNYIIQQMINICSSAVASQKERNLSESEVKKYSTWMERIKERVSGNTSRLERFSSGKKIMEALNRSTSALSIH